jgi:hypothetical protein
MGRQLVNWIQCVQPHLDGTAGQRAQSPGGQAWAHRHKLQKRVALFVGKLVQHFQQP